MNVNLLYWLKIQSEYSYNQVYLLNTACLLLLPVIKTITKHFVAKPISDSYSAPIFILSSHSFFNL